MTLHASDEMVRDAAGWTLANAYQHLGEALLGDGLGLGEEDDDAGDYAKRWFEGRLSGIAKAVCASEVRIAVGDNAADDLVIIATALLAGNFDDLAVALAVGVVVLRRGLDRVCANYDED